MASKDGAAELDQMAQPGVCSVQYNPAQGDRKSGSNRSTEKARERDMNYTFETHWQGLLSHYTK